MNKKSLLTVGALLLAVAFASQAQESRTTQAMRHGAPKGLTEAFFSCINSAGLDQTRMSQCIATERKGQDARLNKAYGTLMGSLDARTKETLRIAERAWLEFNTKSVAAETAIGGANQVTDIDVSQRELFRYCERANVLEDYVSSIGN